MEERSGPWESWLPPVAAVAIAAAIMLPLKVQNKMADFEVYWTAATRAQHAEPLYRPSDEHYQFKYLPAFAMALTPLAALPLPVAKRVWFGISVALLVALVALSLRLLPRPLRLPAWVIVAVTLLALTKFYAHELVLGQTNLLLGAVAVAALAMLHSRRDMAAGATFGAAVIVKPYAAIFLPYLLVTKRFRGATACACMLALALAVPAILYGFQGNLDLLRAWWETVSGSTAATLTNQDNVSIAAMYAKWLGTGPTGEWLTTTTSLVLIGVCGAVATLKRTSLFPEYLEVALLLTAIPLLSPQGWDYVLLLSTPAVMILVDSLPRVSRPLQVLTLACLATIGLTLYDVMGRAAYARFMAMSMLTPCYGSLIGVLAYLRFRQIR